MHFQFHDSARPFACPVGHCRRCAAVAGVVGLFSLRVGVGARRGSAVHFLRLEIGRRGARAVRADMVKVLAFYSAVPCRNRGRDGVPVVRTRACA